MDFLSTKFGRILREGLLTLVIFGPSVASVFPRVFLCVFMLCCFHVGQCWRKVGAFLVQSW